MVIKKRLSAEWIGENESYPVEMVEKRRRSGRKTKWNYWPKDLNVVVETVKKDESWDKEAREV